MSADLEITTVIGCRMACAYCPQPLLARAYSQRDNLKVMTLETFQRCLSTVPSTASITFAGMAEPWLNPACTDMVLHAYSRGHRVVLFTTTFGMTLADVERIKHIPFGHVCIHLPDLEERMKLPVSDEYLAALCAVVRSLHIDSFSLMGTLHPRVRQALGHDVHDSTHSLQSRAGNTHWDGIPQVPRRTGRLDTRHCINHNVLNPNGDVALCCQDYGLKHVLGNLLTQSYAELFEGAEFKKLQRAMNDDSIDVLCRTCPVALPAEGI